MKPSHCFRAEIVHLACIVLLCPCFSTTTFGQDQKVPANPEAVETRNVAESQSKWYEKYKKQTNAPKPAEMLVNTDPEPNLEDGFKPLFDGTDLSGWKPLGGDCQFEVIDGELVGTCVPGSSSTYLSTERDDFADFVFTCEMKWVESCNSGVMFRAQVKPNGKGGQTVFGPQAEMEGLTQGRGWSGGIYGQSCGGYFYPLWLNEHEEVRGALVDGWNRITIWAKGNVVKTWVNGVPAAHWVDDGSYPTGFFGLQIHKGQSGKVRFRNILVKSL